MDCRAIALVLAIGGGVVSSGCGARTGLLDDDYESAPGSTGLPASASSSGADSTGGGGTWDSSADAAFDALAESPDSSGLDTVADATPEAQPIDAAVEDATDAGSADAAGTGANDGSGDGADSASTDAAEGDATLTACQDGATRCSFNGVQTCSSGSWGTAVACPASAPNCSAGACGVPPSCQVSTAGTTNCGVASESCCTTEEVPGGTYYRTYTNSGSGPTGEADPATVSGFRLDKYLVTVGRFRQFVGVWKSSSFAPSAGSGTQTFLNGGQGLANNAPDAGPMYETGWDAVDWNQYIAPTDANLACDPAPTATAWTPSVGPAENLPIDCVNWYEAYAFCIWDGGFLPSEAEWGYVAAGGGGPGGQREYPWGEADPGMNSQYAIFDDHYYVYLLAGEQGIPYLAPVGTASLGAGNWGQFDLAGEVYEWNLDWYAAPYSSCTDCAYLPDRTSYAERAARGGDFFFPASYLLASTRYALAPDSRAVTNGIRCARPP